MKVILSAEFKHETNRYSPGVTDFRIFEARYAVTGKDNIVQAYAGARNEMTGFIDYFADKEDICFEPVLVFNAQPGAVVSAEVWQYVRDTLLAKIRSMDKVDGILLALHGAMVTQISEDGEGDLLEALRACVGPNVPIISTLDLHANVTQKMVDLADGYFPYDYYPHTDLYEAGKRAAQCMYRTVKGQIKPVLAVKKLDYIMSYIPTTHPVMAPFVEKCQSLRKAEKVLTANICQGFFAADIYEQGAAVLVTVDADRQKGQQIADGIGDDLYSARRQFKRDYLTASEAVERAMAEENFPVTIADVSDNPGSGATCDATALLREMLSKKVKDAAVAVIYDPQTVKEAEAAGVGNSFQARIGGKLAPEITGGPIEATAYVCAINDGVTRNREGCSVGLITQFGKCAVLRVDGIKIIVSSVRTQPWGLEIYRVCGIQPADMKILMVKSAVQFRASFETVSSVILDAECPALGPQNPTMLPLSHSRRPIYPLDDM